MIQPMNFAEHVRLSDEHERLTWNYRAAVKLLFRTGYLVSDAEYAKLKASVQKARHDLEVVRAKLHRSDPGHGVRLSAERKPSQP